MLHVRLSCNKVEGIELKENQEMERNIPQVVPKASLCDAQLELQY